MWRDGGERYPVLASHGCPVTKRHGEGMKMRQGPEAGPGGSCYIYTGPSWLRPEEAEAEAAFLVPRNQAQCLGEWRQAGQSLAED